MSAIPSLRWIPARYSATSHANAPETPNRKLILLIVTLAHAGLIAAILLSATRATRERVSAVEFTSLVLLPTESAPSDAPRFAVHLEPPSPRSRILSDTPLPSVRTDGNAITLTPPAQPRPPIDWDHEAALAVESSIAQSAKERSYRNWSGLSPEQLDWLKRNHLEPAPGFHWDRNSRRDMLRHGIFKINDYCVLVVALPFCNFGGKIQYDGDLFRNMRDPKAMD
jgi:hypothetical protein